MTRIPLTFLLALSLLGAPSPGGCAPSQPAQLELYTGEAPVEDQSPRERDRALPLALQHVLQKLSGLRYFDDYPLVEPALSRAQELVLSYYYRSVNRSLPDGQAGEELRLVARFSEPAVDELLRSLRLPVWQPQRAPLTAWLIVDDGAGRRIMPVEFDYTREAMDEIAERRGLPLRWPSPDENGEYSVDEQILWGGYTEDLAESRSQGILIAAARREGTEWGVRINLGYKGQNWTWRESDLDLEYALSDGLEQAIDQIAAQTTIAPDDFGNWQQELTVSGLAGPADYRRCLGYLQGLSVVQQVTVLGAQPGIARFRLDLTALPRYLEENLAAGHVLAPTDPPEAYRMLGTADDDG